MIELKYKTFWRRFWAGVIDGFVFLPLSFLHSWVFASITAKGVLAIWFIISSFSYLAYSVLMHGNFGQTLGKMVTRVKVLDLSESKLSMFQALLRDSVAIAFVAIQTAFYLPTILKGVNPYEVRELSLWSWILSYTLSIWFLAELVTMLTNKKRRAIHDFIARSVVIRLRKET